MSTCLALETSSEACSVAFYQDGHLQSFRISETSKAHVALLTPFIREVLKETECPKPDVVALSNGPGSYTGLRVGLSTAKALAYSWNVPLLCVPTLQIIWEKYLQEHPEAEQSYQEVHIGLDARRMDFFYTRFSPLHPHHFMPTTQSVDPFWIDSLRNNGRHLFLGTGVEKLCHLQPLISDLVWHHVEPDAMHMKKIITSMFQQKQFADLAYVEPWYGKPFYSPSK